MSDEEALAKVRARMAEWHAYVARPDSPEDPAEGQVTLRESNRSAEDPAGVFGTLHSSSVPEAQAEVHAALTYHYEADPELAHPAALTPDPKPEVVLIDHPPLLDRNSGKGAERAVGGPYSLVDLAASEETVSRRPDEVEATFERERELSRQLVEAIAREQELIAREQLLRAHFFEDGPEPQRPTRPVHGVDRWPAERRYRTRSAYHWTLLMAGIVILGSCMIAILIIYLLY